MEKDLKKILKELPEERPRKGADNIVARIIKREIKRWKEKRISWVLLGMLGVLGVLGIVKILEAAEILDTAGFWLMIKEQPALLEWQSFLEGFPVTEGLFVLLISLLLIVPIGILVRKDKWLGR